MYVKFCMYVCIWELYESKMFKYWIRIYIYEMIEININFSIEIRVNNVFVSVVLKIILDDFLRVI